MTVVSSGERVSKRGLGVGLFSGLRLIGLVFKGIGTDVSEVFRLRVRTVMLVTAQVLGKAILLGIVTKDYLMSWSVTLAVVVIVITIPTVSDVIARISLATFRLRLQPDGDLGIIRLFSHARIGFSLDVEKVSGDVDRRALIGFDGHERIEGISLKVKRQVSVEGSTCRGILSYEVLPII